MAFWTEIILSTSGGSLAILSPISGVIDGSNTQFIFSSKPATIVVNSGSYRENNGWTWDSGTLTATLDFAPQLPGDVWGFK